MVVVPQQHEVAAKQAAAAAKGKSVESKGVRVVGGRIYDPENGKTCHQVTPPPPTYLPAYHLFDTVSSRCPVRSRASLFFLPGGWVGLDLRNSCSPPLVFAGNSCSPLGLAVALFLAPSQCRQKTMDFAASCHKIKKNNKQCTIQYCRKCLFNR